MIILVTIVLSICSILRANDEPEQCFADIEHPYWHFSAGTSYYASRNWCGITLEDRCTPTYIWALHRHGTRYPGIQIINSANKLYQLRDEIVLNHREGRSKLCQKDVENFEKWSTNITANLVLQLTYQGIVEQKLKAQEMKKKFPKLFESATKDSFLFQSSIVKRAKDSAILFANQLLGTNFSSIHGNKITINDHLLRVNAHCPKYTKDVYNNAAFGKEVSLFKISNEMKTLISNVSARLGYKQLLTFSSVMLMYNICSYETAWYLNSRPAFCAAFLPDELKVFEYLHDMCDYHRKGYGNSFSEKMGCVTVRDMMMSLVYAANNPRSTRKATFHFSHSEMILPTTVKLGLNRDDIPLMHNNYDTMKDHRKWRLSRFDSFSANIIAVLYKCPFENGTRDIVSLYQNERKAALPFCSSDSCTLDELKHHFNDVFDEEKCNLDFCVEHVETDMGC